ncbi:MAG: PhoPQ-activated pathogenicity-related family protein [Candidatus Bipolaricaulota bacterium]|nr:PhoPQ-activated pathogenicity-related family protein [Candidatus Bipolaricaulota bacterium]MDW8152292.1 PhoPQ-activated protein PqaA family protein [Candidatus Bipolaricaulota bacterium]
MGMRALAWVALASVFGLTGLAQPPTELFDYVRAQRGEVRWEVVRAPEGVPGTWELRLRSQVWRGLPWTHRLLLVDPGRRAVEDVMLLYLGGDPYPGEELLGLALAQAAGLRVAILNSVPNQPLFGLREDALIAHTFARYLAEGSADWPLLFPMVQSAVAAMDALAALAPELWGGKLRGFLLVGASKRGWTAYLAAAVDPRVLGIIPIVFDFLNFPAQLARQEELLGGPSPKLGDYTARGLTTLAAPTPAALRLAWLVDPYSYRYAYTMPKLLVVGSNDPYWATDATALYWPGLPEPKLLYVVPNVGHNVLLGEGVLSTLAAFARAVALGRPLPRVQGFWRPLGDRVELVVQADRPARRARLWRAEGPSPDLDRARWQAEELPGDGQRFVAELRRPSGYLGCFAELEFEVEGLSLLVSTPVRLLGP